MGKKFTELAKKVDSTKKYNFDEGMKLVIETLGLKPEATEADVVTYWDRLRLFGEYNAMLWLKQRQTNAP